MDKNLKAIKIIETKDDPKGEKVLSTVQQFLKGPGLKEILCAEDVKDIPIFVFSITGRARKGKSFLLNLMVKYLQAGNNNDWTASKVHHVFDWEGGMETCTKGLWICPEVFIREHLNTKVGIILMDNQGLCDAGIFCGESVAMCGISTIISHIQLFNMKYKITPDELEQIMCYLVPEQENDEDNKHESTGHRLLFAVRDFMGGEKVGFGLKSGEEYLTTVHSRGTDEHRAKWDKNKTKFDKIECVLLPHPGIKIRSDDFIESGDLNELEDEFFSEVGKFFDQLFSQENLFGQQTQLTGDKIYKILTEVDGKPADNALSFINMYNDQKNTEMEVNMVNLFKKMMSECKNLQGAKDVVDHILEKCAFKGTNATSCKNNLKQLMEKEVNDSVTDYIINKYESILKDGALHNNTTNWPIVKKEMEDLLLGTPKDSKSSRCSIVLKVATIYYTTLGKEIRESTKKEIEDTNPERFFQFYVSLKSDKQLNDFATNKIPKYLDFQCDPDCSLCEKQVDEIRATEQNGLKQYVQALCKKNMYLSKDVIVNGYKKDIKSSNVKDSHRKIWPNVQEKLNCLSCETEKKQELLLREIYKELADIYYRTLGDSLLLKFRNECATEDSIDFLKRYRSLKSDEAMRNYVSKEVPECDTFRKPECTEMWTKNTDHTTNEMNYIILTALHRKGFDKEAAAYIRKINDPDVDLKRQLEVILEVLNPLNIFKSIFGWK